MKAYAPKQQHRTLIIGGGSGMAAPARPSLVLDHDRATTDPSELRVGAVLVDHEPLVYSLEYLPLALTRKSHTNLLQQLKRAA